MFLDLVLIIFEDSHILDFVFFGILKEMTIMFHEGSLYILEFRIDNNLL